MKNSLTLLVVFIATLLPIFAQTSDGTLGNGDRRKIVITQGGPVRPHALEVSEPVAMYTISTATVDFTFDANYYSEYTIHLVGEYVEMDYYVYTPVVYIPVATFGEIVDIYIESEDCGCYYGTLDQSK